MRPHLNPANFPLAHIRNWLVNITPKRVDGLPYSKIKAICHTYRQRLLASRAALAAPSLLPPQTLFLCQPTPSYVLSPQLAARLPKPDLSSLASKLGVYETVCSGNTFAGEVEFVVEEQECTPEVIVEPDLSGDQAIYYGHGQLHVVGMLDMHSTDVKKNPRFSSAVDLQRLLTLECIEAFSEGFADLAETSCNDPGTCIYSNTNEGQRQIARVKADVDYTEGIATASVTLNLAVPTPGFDPDRTCPHNRLEAVGVDSQFTTIWALDGRPASDQDRVSGVFSEHSLLVFGLTRAVQRAMGNGPCPTPEFVDHARALGASDPDLEGEEEEEGWSDVD